MGSVFQRRELPTSSNIPTWVDTRQRDIVLTCIIAPIFTTVFVSLRLYARKFITKQVGWDDWVAGFTLILCIAYSILLSLWTDHGGGMHQADLVQLKLMEDYYQWIEVTSPFYIMACLGYKVSILLLYLRLFSLQRYTIWATWFTIFVTTSYLLANFVVQFVGCQPMEKFWNSDLPGQCIDFVSSDIGFGSLNVITDFMIFALPLPALWRSSLSWRDKWGATLVFLTGAIAFVAALVRFQYAIKDLTADDRTYLAGLTFLWMVIEINTGLICSCGPALKPLYRKIFAPETLDRYVPKPVHHALNNLRKPQSIWRISAEVDSQATLTNNSMSGGAYPGSKSPWKDHADSDNKQAGMDLELHDIGGFLQDGNETVQPPPRTQRFASDAPTFVEEDGSHASRTVSNDNWIASPQDSPTAVIQRQTSFV